MYLRTPKRYSANRRRRHLFNFRWLWLWVITPLVAFGGLYLYRNRDMYAPMVSTTVEQAVSDAMQGMSTMAAPTPTATADPANRLSIAAGNWQIGRLEDALAEYRIVIDAVPNDVSTHFNFTFSLIMEGLTDEALVAAENTVTADPFSSDAWAILALAQVRAGRPTEAIPHALYALELDPNNARALAYLAEAYLDTNQPDRAENTVEQALALNPDSADAHYARGLVNWLANFDLETARNDFETAYRIMPQMISAAINMAVLEASLGEPQDGIDALVGLLEVNPQNTTALYWIGLFYNRDIGNPERAGDYLQRCVGVDPRNITCNYYYGRILMRLQQYDQALERFVIAVEAGSTNGYHYWWAGQAHIVLGNCPAALNYLNPGVILAEEAEDQALLDSYRVSFNDCRAFVGSLEDDATPTPELTPEAEIGEGEGSDVDVGDAVPPVELEDGGEEPAVEPNA